MKHIFRWAVASILIAVVLAVAYFRPDRAIGAASGLMAHNVCSATFISHVDPGATANELVKPMLPRLVGPLFRIQVDREHKTVAASVAGLKAMRAKYTEGYGCRLMLNSRYGDPAPATSRAASTPDSFAPPTPVNSQDPSINSALDVEFTEQASVRPRFVKAIVVVKDGHVIAERYAPGFSLETPVLSYSVAKSFT